MVSLLLAGKRRERVWRTDGRRAGGRIWHINYWNEPGEEWGSINNSLVIIIIIRSDRWHMRRETHNEAVFIHIDQNCKLTLFFAIFNVSNICKFGTMQKIRKSHICIYIPRVLVINKYFARSIFTMFTIFCNILQILYTVKNPVILFLR